MSSLPPPAPPGPPAYPAPATYPPPPEPHGYGVTRYRSLHTVSRWLLALLGVSVALQVLNLPVIIAVRSRAVRYRDGRISTQSFQDTLNRQALIRLPLNGVAVGVAVMSIIWMYRVAENHRALARQGSRWSPGWAIGGWFIPLLVVPWLMLRELWRGSDPASPPGDPHWRQRRASPLLTAWWVVYALAPVGGTLVTLAGISFGDSEERTAKMARAVRHLYGAEIVSSVMTIVGGLLFAKVVWDLTRRQQALTGVP